MATKSIELKSVPGVPEPKDIGSLSAYGTARSTVQGTPLSAEELRKIQAYWRACNYRALA